MKDRFTFKVLILGDGGIGKTTLINRYISGKFQFDTKMTIGVSFFLKTIEYEDKIVNLQIWDFGGQEQFRFVLPMYFSGAFGIILMYSVVDLESVIHFDDWYQMIYENTDEIPILLAGSKIDLFPGKNTYSPNLEQIMNKNRIKDHIKFSSRTGQNVDILFDRLVELMINNISPTIMIS